MLKTILGVFSDRNSAESAINKLESIGYNPKEMSIMMKDRSEERELAKDTGAGEVAEGVASGATTGALLGGLAGLLASTVIPGIGAFFIGGPIVTALGLGGAAATTASGAITGAAAGGMIGALVSAFGLNENEARTYQERINSGGILVAVPAHTGEEDEVHAILEEHGADNIRMVSQGVESTSKENMRTSAVRQYLEDEEAQYAVGAKGGKSQRTGWVDDSKHHADARRGDEPHSDD